jgi:hypothetical protein
MKCKTILAAFLLCISLGTSESSAQPYFLFSAGLHRNSVIGTGQGGNHFDAANGFCMELGLINTLNGFSMILWGLSICNPINHVYQSEQKTQLFTPYYTELRFPISKRPKLFMVLGFDWNRLHFPKTKGSDNQYVLSTGLGAYISLGKSSFIQPKIRPYFIFSNSLEQSLGIALQLNIGSHTIKRSRW